MYIFDCLYGKIEFSKTTIRCMLTPEMQRLREVRLGNINSLCLTGSANINRYEHCVGTAYLAIVNQQANKHYFPQKKKDIFVYAALFHDLANGPFGHAYEYIVERQGFVPEKGIGDVIFGKTYGAHKKMTSLQQFYLGEPNGITKILSKEEIESVDLIVRGDDKDCSKILSNIIDIDNIDNVYRMAYHMGLAIDKNAPIELAKGIICMNDKIYFKASSIPYIYDWYETRSKVYKLLLYNVEDFSAKCMMTEVMDLVLSRDPNKIKWQYTDSELIQALLTLPEEWNEEYIHVLSGLCINIDELEKKLLDSKLQRDTLSQLSISIPQQATINFRRMKDYIDLTFFNTTYRITANEVMKKSVVAYNPSKTITRMMCGDLYGCIGIFVSLQIDKYGMFSIFESRRKFEEECNKFIEREYGYKSVSIAFHAIIDKNKTNRQIEVNMESGENILIGKNTHELLIGAFAKSKSLGMKSGGLTESKREKMSNAIRSFLRLNGITFREHGLYSEVDDVG